MRFIEQHVSHWYMQRTNTTVRQPTPPKTTNFEFAGTVGVLLNTSWLRCTWGAGPQQPGIEQKRRVVQIRLLFRNDEQDLQVLTSVDGQLMQHLTGHLINLFIYYYYWLMLCVSVDWLVRVPSRSSLLSLLRCRVDPSQTFTVFSYDDIQYLYEVLFLPDWLAVCWRD